MGRRILVTGGDTFFATRLVHQLGLRGCDVTVADSHWLSPGKASRYATRRLKTPALSSDPGGYLDAILRELSQRSYDLLLPTFEETLLFTEYQADIRRFTRLFVPPFGTMHDLHHKPSLHAKCLQLGLPTPPSVEPRTEADLESMTRRIAFPVVLKLPMGNNSAGLTFCDNRASLIQSFSRLAARQAACGGEPPFVQQKIDGDLVFTLCFCDAGRKLAEVVYRTRRTYPEAGGTSAHRESIRGGEVARLSERLVAATRWTGFLGLDFIVERSTGTAYLIDANTRANPAVHLGFLAGLDWAQLVIDRLADVASPVQTAKPGVHVHSLLLDLGWLLERFSLRPTNLAPFLLRCAEFITPPWPVHSRNELLEIGEPLSGVVMALQAATCLARSAVFGGDLGQMLFEAANYNSATAAQYRNRRCGNFVRDSVA